MNARRGWRKLSCLQSTSLSSLPLREIPWRTASHHTSTMTSNIYHPRGLNSTFLSHICAPGTATSVGTVGWTLILNMGGEGPLIAQVQFAGQRRSCPLNDLLQKQGKQPKSYFLCFDWGLKHHALAFNKPSELVKIGPWAYVLVDLTVVFHGNQRVRDQIASEVISRLISRSILHEQMYTYQNKTLKQQICVSTPKSA